MTEERVETGLDKKFYVPRRIRELFKEAVLVAKELRTSFTEENLSKLQSLINEAQPNKDEEPMFRTIQLLYWSNPEHFFAYLNHARLSCFVFWTESRRIAIQLRVGRTVYIGYKDGHYTCSRFQKSESETERPAQPVRVKRASPTHKNRPPPIRIYKQNKTDGEINDAWSFNRGQTKKTQTSTKNSDTTNSSHDNQNSTDLV